VARRERGERSISLGRVSRMSSRFVLRRLARHVLREWKALACLLVSTWASSLLDLALPYVTGIVLLDRVIRGKRLDQLELVVVALVAIFVGQKLADFSTDYVQVRVSQRFVHRLRCDLFEHVERLPVAFFDRHQTGEVLTRLTVDIDTIDTLVSSVLPGLAGQLVTLGGALVLLCATSPVLTLFVVPTVIALAASVAIFKGRVRTYARRVRDAAGLVSVRATEAIAGVRVIKAFSAESFEADRFEKDSSEVFTARLRSVVPQSFFTASVDACVLTGTLLVVVFGTHRILAGTLTVGALVTSLGYLNRIYNEAKKTSRMNIPIQRVLVAAERIFEIMDMTPESPPATWSGGLEGAPRADGAAAVRFANVSFDYGTSRPVLRDVSLEIAAGDIVALVGHSGGGKTTLVNLLLRFYEPTAGDILVDGVPLRELPLAQLRAQIGVVSQDTFLFSGTIRENIAYGTPDVPQDRIIAAARAAFVHDFVVDLPDRYETHVGERGAMLSGGQRQRIAIARALLRDPRILIFDEATSNLDAESERYVQLAIRSVARGRTVLVVAHRLSTAAWADKIAVIEEGEIVETGSHEALLRQKGIYSRLSTIQQHAQVAGS
jgi:subfamily B ATP-binding cassette protein MsbA